MENRNIDDLYDKLDSIEQKLQKQIDIEDNRDKEQSEKELSHWHTAAWNFTIFAILILVIAFNQNGVSSNFIGFAALLVAGMGIFSK